MTENTGQKQTVGVIDIGSSAIRMVVAEVDQKGGMRYLENPHKLVQLGKDVFTTGRISNTTIRECLAILKNFKSILDTYGVKHVHAVATSAVRDAMNRENFVDKIYIRTGIEVEIIEGAEQNRLDLIAVEHALEGKFDYQKKSCLIIEVGSGSTEMIILNQGEVEHTRTLSMGSIRLPEQMIEKRMRLEAMQRLMKRSIRGIAEHAAKEHRLDVIDTFIALGGDMRLAVRQIAGDPANGFTVLEKKEFLKFVDLVSKMSVEEVVTKFGMSFSEAESLYPALLFYANFLDETRAENIIVPSTSIRDALLLEMAQLFSGNRRTDLSKQVMNSVRSLARKYMYDASHALCVSQLALKLFDALKNEHGLGSRERLLLEASATLHDIGMYIAAASHHKHSSYLVDASEIFGLRKMDKDIISNVVRYHRRSSPQPSHVSYMSLPKASRAIASKLAAILRVADALDRSHQQKIRNFTFVQEKERFALWVSDEAGDLSAERGGLAKKDNMFNDIFGAPIVLRQGKPPKRSE
jgi:exopolyphosphatase / guanosine-5'-triphosphate,3'-diphosphate pyrophosphatase